MALMTLVIASYHALFRICTKAICAYNIDYQTAKVNTQVLYHLLNYTSKSADIRARRWVWDNAHLHLRSVSYITELRCFLIQINLTKISLIQRKFYFSVFIRDVFFFHEMLIKAESCTNPVSSNFEIRIFYLEIQKLN